MLLQFADVPNGIDLPFAEKISIKKPRIKSMSIKTISNLVLNHENYQLEYKDKEKKKDGVLVVGLQCVVSAVIYPLFLLMSPLLVPSAIINVCGAKKKQAKTIDILKDPALLEKYKAGKLAKLEKRVSAFEKAALSSIRVNKSLLGELGQYDPKWDGAKKRQYWDTFLKTDFNKMLSDSKLQSTRDRFEKFRIKFRALEMQAGILSTEQKDTAFEEILKCKAIKNSFKVIDAKHRLKETLLYILPLGLMLIPSSKARSTYEGKKELLPQVPGFEAYTDLVDAHNKLIKNSSTHLVPLLKDFK